MFVNVYISLLTGGELEKGRKEGEGSRVEGGREGRKGKETEERQKRD